MSVPLPSLFDVRFHYPILAVAALRGRDGRLRAGSGIVAGFTVGLYAPLLESGNGSVLAEGVGLRLHCAADLLEHHSTDTFPGGRSDKKCQFCSKKDANSSELQMLSYTPRRRISQFIWIPPSQTLLVLHAALLSGRQRYCLIDLSLRQNFANWFSVGVVLRGLGAQRFP
jgi:hypothetical protein